MKTIHAKQAKVYFVFILYNLINMEKSQNT